jgi:hypothetical protein
MNEAAVNLFHQADAARKRGDNNAAKKYLAACLQLDDTVAGGWFNLGVDAQSESKRELAIAMWRRCVELVPEEPKCRTNLAWNLHLAGRYEEAVAQSRQAMALGPDLPLGWANLSLALSTQHDAAGAITAARRAVQLDPIDSQNQLALAFALLFDGQWAEGLRLYEARFPYKLPEFLSYPMPKWDGSPVDTLFIPAEQGLGDTIQFGRYVPLAAERCEHVVLAVQKELAPLLTYGWYGRHLFQCPNVRVEVLPVELPAADAFCAMMSLPVALGLSDDEIPEVDQHWIPCISHDVDVPETTRKKIGIVWAGSSEQENDRHRSSTVEDFLGLYSCPGIQLYSLQVGDRARECRVAGPLIQDFSNEIRNFADTAVLVQQMDAVVTVCTSVAHLSGALGVPTYVVLPRQGQHFIWQHGTKTTPWYPSVRLFRQERRGDWSVPIAEVARELGE